MGSGNTCVKVANDTFKVMKQHNYIIMMVTEVVTCVSYTLIQLHILRNSESGNTCLKVAKQQKQ